ncbi:MAG: imidazolonepropionase [Candidatus Eisenbacteria bacterium]|nr:imidazolonepropionase [Candidatus Eisenbacteria bacterium]
MRERVDILLREIAALVTMDQGAVPRAGGEAQALGRIDDGAIAIRGDRIAGVGSTDEICRRYEATPDRVISLPGSTVLPGFIDPHTHVLFAGSRDHEFSMRLEGRSYMEIAAMGGGILSSVKAFRDASDDKILSQTRARLDQMLSHGVTTIEAKSGYGLDSRHEIRALKLLDILDEEHPIDILTTLLGAHDIPPDYRDRRESYVREIVDEMIPAAASQTRVRFCDVFCEKGVFTPQEARTILETGRRHGLTPRLHADEFAPSGASELAGEIRAVSADHLMEASDEGLAALKRAGTIAILLPATTFSMGSRRYAPAGKISSLGIPIALATDCNPGSSMTTNLPLVLTLAVLEMKMSVAEALTAVTVNAAHSLGLAGEVGRLAPGLLADLQVLPASNPAAIVYHLGGLAPSRVMKRGRWVIEGTRLASAGKTRNT